MSEAKENKLTQAMKNLSPKAKQYVVLGGLATVFFGLVFGSVAMWDAQPPMAPQAAKTEYQAKNIATPGAQLDPKDVWMSQSGQHMREMETAIQEMRTKLQGLEQGQGAGAGTGQPTPESKSILPPLPPMPPLTTQAAPVPPPAPPTPTPQPAFPQPAPEKPMPPGVAVLEIPSPSQVEKQEGGKERSGIYLPSGSFARVTLLGGLDAPAGGQAQNNPLPVVMQVVDHAFLPNQFRAKTRGCHILGTGYGDISSERAYIRLESLSCVLTTGEVVDAAVRGHVFGEDGKAGARGRVVSKQGQILANALMTGVISGIGQGVQQSATTYSTSALGSVGTVEPGKQIQAGIGSGVGKALDRLSQYYITLAEKTFPVIEVDAGRSMDVVFTKGVNLGLLPQEEDEYSEVWKRGRAIQRKPITPDK